MRFECVVWLQYSVLSSQTFFKFVHCYLFNFFKSIALVDVAPSNLVYSKLSPGSPAGLARQGAIGDMRRRSASDLLAIYLTETTISSRL